jgi:hypothetical protein
MTDSRNYWTLLNIAASGGLGSFQSFQSFAAERFNVRFGRWSQPVDATP